MDDNWNSGIAYDRYMGRWSRLVAKEFLQWLALPLAKTWMDIGCGTGNLTKLILESYQPEAVVPVDASISFIFHAKRSITGLSTKFVVSLAQSLGLNSSSIDATVSGLVLNFIPDPEAAILEMMRVTKPGGKIGIFLWDYADGMQMLRYFWDAAVELKSEARDHDEGVRFPICREGWLESLFQAVGLKQVESTAIEIETIFQDFNDYWEPFLGNVGSAPTYTMALNHSDRRQLEENLRARLPVEADGSITMTARAWAVKGTV